MVKAALMRKTMTALLSVSIRAWLPSRKTKVSLAKRSCRRAGDIESRLDDRPRRRGDERMRHLSYSPFDERAAF
jgi:hypothetical protein